MKRRPLLACAMSVGVLLSSSSCDVLTPPTASGTNTGTNTNANANSNSNANGGGTPPGGQPATSPSFGFALKIARHVDQPLTENELDTIFAIATGLLQRQDFECPDVACPVTFGRDGPIRAFETGSAVITSETELDAVFEEPGDIKVLAAMVGVCGIPATDDTAVILGCAFSGGSVAIVRDADPDVWAHEWGHVQGLDHRDDCPRNLMHSFELRTNAVNNGECQAFLTPTPQARLLTPSTTPTNPTDAAWSDQSLDPALPQVDETRRQWLERITAPRYIAGLPAGTIRTCDDDRLCDVLVPMLSEDGTPAQQCNIARAMGLTGDARAAAPLIGQLDRLSGALGIGEFQVAAEQLLALGRLAGTDPDALAYLEQAVATRYWTQRGVVLDNGVPLADSLSGVAIMALGISRAPEAADYLAAIRAPTDWKASPARIARIDEALARFAPINADRTRRTRGRRP